MASAVGTPASGVDGTSAVVARSGLDLLLFATVDQLVRSPTFSVHTSVCSMRQRCLGPYGVAGSQVGIWGCRKAANA